MTSEIVATSSPILVEQRAAEPAKSPRVWPAVAMIGLFWTVHFVTARMELPTFVRFLESMALSVLLALGFLLWWFLNRRVRLRERFVAFAAAILGGVLAAPLCQQTLGVWILIFMVPPYVITVWTAWLLFARRASVRMRLLGLPAVLLLTWAAFTLIRFNGISGEQQAEYHWRWTPTAEELYEAELAQRREAVPPPGTPSRSLVSVQTGDWPGFRGPERDGVVRGAAIATNWKTHPPKQLWRQRVGPGWSSMAVVNDRLYTQEQRGQFEAVVCLDAATGRELWAHQDEVRFRESVAGAGPRATPTFADGRLYTLGATGILNCLDAASGERRWQRDMAADAGAKPPQWGFASSPLVEQGLVVVFAGGEGDKGLLAYRADSGEPAWTAAAGQNSYSSPQRAALAGQEQILFWSDRGLTAVDPASGEVFWQHDVLAPGAPRSLQPHVLDEGHVLISSESDLGTAFLDVKRHAGTWTVARRWASKRLQPSFNDYVIHDGAIYGFDGALFCCVDLQTGARRWKDGRYGHGQVVLLADQSLLVVAAESGHVVLIEANSEGHKELGRFQAIEGKTWNHPAIAQGRLYVRNGEEIACYELEITKGH